MVRAEFIEKNDLKFSEIPDRLFEDHEFYNSVLRCGGKIIVVPEVLYGYRDTSRSMIKTFDPVGSLSLVREQYRNEAQGLSDFKRILGYIDIETKSRAAHQRVWNEIDNSPMRDILWELSKKNGDDRVQFFFEKVSQAKKVPKLDARSDAGNSSRGLIEPELFRSSINATDVEDARAIVAALKSLEIKEIDDIINIYPGDFLTRYVILVELIFGELNNVDIDGGGTEYCRDLIGTVFREYGMTIDVAAATALFYDRVGASEKAKEFVRIAKNIQDKAYYKKYPDVGMAAAKGNILSSRSHYAQFGKMEGRELPLPVLNWPFLLPT